MSHAISSRAAALLMCSCSAALLAGLCFPQTSAADLTRYWRLDGDATAAVGGFDGIISGATAATGFDGGAGGSLQFAPGDTVTFGNVSASAHTMAMWVNLSNAVNSSSTSLSLLQHGGSVSQELIEFGPATGNFAGETLTILDGSNVRTAISDNFSAGWHHIAFRFNPTLGTPQYEFFVDGVGQVAPLEGNSGHAPIMSLTNLILNGGQALGGSQNTFDGRIDDLAVWDTSELSAAETRALFTLGNEPDLQFDAGEVNELIEAFEAGTSANVGGLNWTFVGDGSLPGDDGDLIDLGLRGFRLNLGGGNGFTTFIPEPSSALLLACGLLVLHRRRRRGSDR